MGAAAHGGQGSLDLDLSLRSEECLGSLSLAASSTLLPCLAPIVGAHGSATAEDDESSAADDDKPGAAAVAMPSSLDCSETAALSPAATVAHRLLTPLAASAHAAVTNAASSGIVAASGTSMASLSPVHGDAAHKCGATYGCSRAYNESGASSDTSLEDGWEAEPLADGRVYWWNVQTEETTWNKPRRRQLYTLQSPAPPPCDTGVLNALPPRAPGLSTLLPTTAAEASVPHTLPPQATLTSGVVAASDMSAAGVRSPYSYGAFAARQAGNTVERAPPPAESLAHPLPAAPPAQPPPAHLPSGALGTPATSACFLSSEVALSMPSEAALSIPGPVPIPTAVSAAVGVETGTLHDVAVRRQLNEERHRLVHLTASLDAEREAHAQRVTRLNQREMELRARESAQRTAMAGVEATRVAVEVSQREANWVHWRRDRMRELMRELITKRPTDGWRRRMERMHTALDLSERDNARLRTELQRIANAGGLGGAECVAAAAATAAAATAVRRGGLQEDLLAKYEALQLESAQAAECLRLARKASASQEAYLGVLETEAREAETRNASQQRRLEALTAENSKLKKEGVKLRDELTKQRMGSFEHELLHSELRGAKDAAAAMEAQLQRLHSENAALREGGGLHDELTAIQEQLREALHAKDALRVAMARQVRTAQTEAAVAACSLADADEELHGLGAACAASAAWELAEHARVGHAHVLLLATARLGVVRDDGALRWALLAWASALPLVEMDGFFGHVSQRVEALELSAAAMAAEVGALQLAESGGLAIHSFHLLHDTTSGLLLHELRSTEEAAEIASHAHAVAAAKLRKRESDLVLLIESYQDLHFEHRTLREHVAQAEDGSAAHAARLAAELADMRGQLQLCSLELARRTMFADEAHEALRMRERQLALLLKQAETARVEADLQGTHTSVEASRLRGMLNEREAQLVAIVRDLYDLAAAERVPGAVAHDARSRVYRRCASVYEALGEAAFQSNEGPPAPAVDSRTHKQGGGGAAGALFLCTACDTYCDWSWNGQAGTATRALP